MDDEIKGYLLILIAEDADRNADHLNWLRSPEAADEEDRDQQTAECEHAIEMATKAAKALDQEPRRRGRRSIEILQTD